MTHTLIRKATIIMLCGLIILATMPSVILADYGEPTYTTSGYFTYHLFQSNTLAAIIDVNSSIDGNITIPDSFGRCRVVSIGDSAFSSCKHITSITIPDSITSIGDSAFSYCTGLESINVKNGNRYYYSKGNCLIETKTKTLIAGCKNSVIPADCSVTSIGNRAFEGCSGLASIKIPISINSIGSHAFTGCTGLKTAGPIGGGYNYEFEWIDSIPNSAFEGCSELTSITIPDSINSIGSYALDNTAWYSNQPDGLVYAGKVAYKYKGTCPTSIVIKNDTRGISDYAFEGCTELTSITIPDSIDLIGSYALDNTAWYNNQPDGLVYAGKVAYKYKGTCPTSIVIKNDTRGIADYAFSGCTGLTSITIPDGVTSIGDYAFDNCVGLTSITIPDSVTSIGDYAFYGCTGLTSITIPDLVTSIGYYTFYGCTGLTSITIPDSVTSIGDYAFYGCSGLTSITIPDSVTLIGNSTFRGCNIKNLTIAEDSKAITSTMVICKDTLESVIIPDSVTSIGNAAFSGCIGLTEITIPDSVTSIGVGAFSGCSSLEEITLPFVGDRRHATKDTYQYPFGYIFGESSYTGGSATTQQYYGSSTSSTKSNTYYVPSSLKKVTVTDCNYLQYGAFYNCTGLTEITISDSVTSIGNYAFFNCTGLTSITIPDSVTWVGESVFSGCTWLTSITIPDSVTSIGASAFSSCTRLTSITIPDSVTSIGFVAFYNCTRLTSITIPDSVTSIDNYAFEGCTGLTSVTIGDSVTSIGSSAFYGCTRLTSVTIPDSVTSIGGGAFEGCNRLGLIIIPKTVKTIGNNSFPVNTKILCYKDSAAESYAKNNKNNYTIIDKNGILGENTYYFIENNKLYIIGTGETDNWKTQAVVPWYDYAEQIKEVIIGEGITKIGTYAFYCLDNLESVICKNPDAEFGRYALNTANEDLTVYAQDGALTEYCQNSNIECIDVTPTPELESLTADTITIKTISGYEYSIDKENWQTGGLFTGLSPANKYNIYARLAKTNDEILALGTPLTIVTVPEYQSHTDDSITLVASDNCEYSIDGENWQVSNTFTGLSKNTIYRFYERVVKDGYISVSSKPLIIAIPDKPQVIRTTGEKIVVKRIDGFEYCLDDFVWQSGTTFNMLLDDTEYNVYQRLKAIDGEKAYQITSEATAVITVDSGSIPGDINGDDAVNNKDLTRLFQYLSDWDVEVDEAALDVNGDGAVNNKDLTRLFQYLSDWDVEIF